MGTLTAEDRLDIIEAIATYSRCIDEPRWDDLPGLFTANAAIDCGPLGQYEGTDGIGKFVSTLKSIGQMMRHYTTNITIRGDGERARTHVYVLAMVGPGPGKLTATTGFYEDELVKQNGRWLFQSRRVLLDMPRG
jgi:SnoaL-like domain